MRQFCHRAPRPFAGDLLGGRCFNRRRSDRHHTRRQHSDGCERHRAAASDERGEMPFFVGGVLQIPTNSPFHSCLVGVDNWGGLVATLLAKGGLSDPGWGGIG
jgi:hypothetical protein